MQPVRHVRLAAVSLILAAASAAWAAPEPVGPQIGNNRYRGTISAADDRDDFTGRFVPGDRITATVTVPRSAGALRPTLVLVDPDGIERTAPVVATPTGVALRGWRVTRPGVWAVRVGGTGGTTGEFTVSFRVQSAAKSVLRGVRLGGDVPLHAAHEFSACDGATLTATLVEKKGGTAVAMRSLSDAEGDDVLAPDGTPAVDRATRRARTTTLRNVALDAGTGVYTLVARTAYGTARYDLTLDVRAPRRPASARVQQLTTIEPFLDAAAAPIVAAAGSTVRFTGSGFSAARPPAVLFGRTPSASVTVGEDGTTLDVLVPARKGPAVVDVRAVNADGQGSLRPLHFAWIPAPVVTALVDAATGEDVRTSPAAGGRTVRLLGAHFEEGHIVTFGGVAASSVVVAGSGELRFALPPAADGHRTVTVADPFGRSGTSSFDVRWKTPPSIAADGYAPRAVKVGTPTTVTVSGSHFAPEDQLLLGGQPAAATFVDPGTFTFDVPALPAGTRTVRLIDAIGTVVDGPEIRIKVAPSISAVTVPAADSLPGNVIPLCGGSVIRVDGAEFAADDVMTLGGVEISSFLVSTATRREFAAPAASAGIAGLSIVDGAGQTAAVADAVRYAGLADVSASRAPAASAVDGFAGLRAAAGDLDGDGLADDLVLAATLTPSIGSRSERTRILLGDAQGMLADATSTAVPAAQSDAAQADSWDATCLALGDLDGANGPDVILGGRVSADGTPQRQVRLFLNGGGGSFALDEALAPLVRETPVVTGYYYGSPYTVFGAVQQQGVPRAIVTGDLDGTSDGNLDPDVIVGLDRFESRGVQLDPQYVDFTTSPPTIQSLSSVNYTQYLHATRVYANRIRSGGGLEDVSAARLPSAGDDRSGSSPLPAFHCRDLALGDLDADGDLDLVVAWDDPLTVTAKGVLTTDVARTATRVLLNDGSGKFTDATASWMPAAGGQEYWQADRIALADLTGDGRPELVLVTRTGLDAWTGAETHARTALRVLRNDASSFTDVTASAVPPVVAANADDFRADALLVTDLDRDGVQDLVIATDDALRTPAGAAAPRLRPLFGTASLQFALRTGFAESPSVDTGEADALVIVPDLGGAAQRVLLLAGETLPAASPATRPSLRAQIWRK